MAMMSSMESSLKNVAEPAVGTVALPETARTLESIRQISPEVAHELNNIITIIQGYAERLLSKNSGNPALEPNLKLISEAARRAAIVVHTARPHQPDPAIRPNSLSPQPSFVL